MTKMDIMHAYRNVPVHPEDRLLLGMMWEGKVYVDKTLPFGLRSAPDIHSSCRCVDVDDALINLIATDQTASSFCDTTNFGNCLYNYNYYNYTK